MKSILTDKKRFVDSDGRERIFSGMNICDKGAWNGRTRRYEYVWDSGRLPALRARGFNLIRLGTTWDAVEPYPGRYNDKYIDALGAILDECEKYGIYAFIDMHQDLYSGFGDGPGDGAPSWATLTDEFDYRHPMFVWAEGYFWGKAVHRAFDNFWANKPYQGKGLEDYYADMWKHVAERLGDKKALFGFDMMNEPFPGSDGGKAVKAIVKKGIRTILTDKKIKKGKMLLDAFKKDRVPLVLAQIDGEIVRKVSSAADGIIKKFDNERYSPFLDKTASAIREGTDNGIILMENSYFSNAGIPFTAPAIKVNGETEKKLCFAPHAYDLMVDTPYYKYASFERVGSMFAEHRRTQERLNTPVVVGEWGGNSVGTDRFPHVEALIELFDRNKWSNTYWCYYDGLLDMPLADVLSHPYPQAVTGKISSYGYDRAKKEFTLSYTQEKKYASETEIYVTHAPREVTLDGKAPRSLHTLDLGGQGKLLSIKTAPGEHTVKVRL